MKWILARSSVFCNYQTYENKMKTIVLPYTAFVLLSNTHRYFFTVLLTQYFFVKINIFFLFQLNGLPFDDKDISLFEAFAIFCGIGRNRFFKNTSSFLDIIFTKLLCFCNGN
jgi:hypothetical protein